MFIVKSAAHSADLLDCNLSLLSKCSRNSMKREEMKQWKGQRGQWYLALSRRCMQYIYT